jgi:hypothetical protein
MNFTIQEMEDSIQTLIGNLQKADAERRDAEARCTKYQGAIEILQMLINGKKQELEAVQDEAVSEVVEEPTNPS